MLIVIFGPESKYAVIPSLNLCNEPDIPPECIVLPLKVKVLPDAKDDAPDNTNPAEAVKRPVDLIISEEASPKVTLPEIITEPVVRSVPTTARLPPTVTSPDEVIVVKLFSNVKVFAVASRGNALEDKALNKLEFAAKLAVPIKLPVTVTVPETVRLPPTVTFPDEEIAEAVIVVKVLFSVKVFAVASCGNALEDKLLNKLEFAAKLAVPVKLPLKLPVACRLVPLNNKVLTPPRTPLLLYCICVLIPPTEPVEPVEPDISH